MGDGACRPGPGPGGGGGAKSHHPDPGVAGGLHSHGHQRWAPGWSGGGTPIAEVGATSGERVEVRLLRQQPRDLFWMALASLALAGLAWVAGWPAGALGIRSEEHTSELQSRENLVCRLLLEKKKEMTTRRVQTM